MLCYLLVIHIELMYVLLMWCFSKKNFDETLGNSLMRILLKCGPPGIKIGQVLSHRNDILSDSTCLILSKLTNNVPGLSDEEESRLLKNARSFVKYDGNAKKLGAGCVAITYLVECDGESMVMKLKRPNIEEDIRVSLSYLTRFLCFISKFDVINVESKLSKVHDALMEQTDFLHEHDELQYFSEKYSDSDFIKVPKVFSSKCNEDIITQEYLEGKNLSDLEPEGKKKMGELLWDFAFETSFIDGHWHSDLHKGNLIFLENKLGVIDYGLTGKLKGFERSIVLNYNTHLLKRDWDKAARIYVNKMTDKTDLDIKMKKMFLEDISKTLEECFDSDNVDIMRSVSKLSVTSKKYGTQFNNKFVTFELGFSTFACTMVELGYPNIFKTMKDFML